MPFVPVPKDLAKVKTKVAFNLTARQLICFGAGGLKNFYCSVQNRLCATLYIYRQFMLRKEA